MKNLYVETLSRCIRKQCKAADADGGRLQFLVPDISGSDAVLLLADCKDIAAEFSLELVFRIADECRTASGWTPADCAALGEHFAGGNLTQYRNEVEDGRLVVLLGVELAADRGSLSDFYQCSADALFAETMGGTFRPWVVEWLGGFGVEASKDWKTAWDSVLGVLVEDASLSRVSRMLEAVPADAGIASEQEAMEALLGSIPCNLSAFAKKARKPRRQTFRYYVNSSNAFFNYASFLDGPAREKALKAIDNFARMDPPLEIDVAPFSTREDLLDALRGYIGVHATDRVDELRRADFLAINDLILQAKPPKSKKEPKVPLQKLSGSPLEVLLRGAWRTLGQFMSDAEENPDWNGIIPQRIEFTGIQFKHDLPDQDMADETTEFAREYLHRLLGGLDKMLSERIHLHLDGDNPSAEVAVVSDLVPENLSVKSARAGEPFFEFRVTVSGPGGTPNIYRRFALRLPDIHPYRLANTLLEEADEAMERRPGERGLVPVFHLPYYRELLLSREGEETSRVLDAALRALDGETFLSNVFTRDWREHSSAKPMKGLLDELSKQFRIFLRDCRERGIHDVIGQEATVPFVKAYQEAVEAFAYGGKDLPDGVTEAREVGAMLMRAFLFVDSEHGGESVNTWGVEKFEPSAVVTILHPALVEMLQAQWVFLLDAFAKAAENEYRRGQAGKAFKDRVWTGYADLADVKAPLVGLPVTESGKFVVTDPGSALVFRIGSLPPGTGLAATRFLTRYNQIDEDEIAAEDLVRETSESRLLCRTLCDFFRLHAGAKDGLSLAVCRNEDIQPVLAGIDAFVRYLDRKIPPGTRVGRYSIRLAVFSESSDTSVVAQWLSAWQDLIESKEDSSGPYAGCSFSISHRLVGPGEEGIRQLAKTIRADVDADVFFLYDFIRPDSQGCVFEKAKPYVVTTHAIKFPILEQSQCASTKPNERFRRSQIVSNRQFKAADAHANLAARVKDPGVPADARHIVLATGDYTPWRDVVDAAHEKAEWVVAVDPLVDRALIAQREGEGTQLKRELIGFGSGVGQHGESNYTVSTQQYRLGELKDRLLSAMRGVFPYGSPERDSRIAQTLLDEAKELSGLSLVRALGPGEYVRDFLAYGILHRIIPLEETGHLCDRLFSIDAYRHWFDLAADDNRHPDLLWLRADIEGDRLRLKATLIECKMGKSQNMPSHLEKAKTQIENGLRVLRPLFAPSVGGLAAGRPDQRYWFLQLHRMIASAAPASEDKAAFLPAMENLADGNFEIEWDAAVYTFVTDETRSPELDRIEILSIVPDEEGEAMSVPMFQSGYAFIDAVCQPDAKPKLVWLDSIDLTGGTPPDYAIRDDRRADEDDETEDEDEEKRQDFDSDDDDEDDGPEPEPEPEEPVVPIPTIPQPVAPLPPPPSEPLPQPSDEVEQVVETPNITPVPNTSPVPSPSVVPSAPHAIPDRILLGKTKAGKEVFWEFGHPKLNNRHFLIFGNSGMGKTYAIEAILAELARKVQNSLIVDYTNGFLNKQLKEAFLNSVAPLQHIVRRDGLPINPFRKGSDDDGCGGTLEESEWDVATRVTSIFDSVYNLGDQQRSVLIDAIQSGMSSNPAFGMSDLLPALEAFLDDGVHQQSALKSVISKLKPFVAAKLFREGESIGWDELFSDKSHPCQVFQMTMLDRTTYLLLTEFALWDLYSTARTTWDETRPHVIVLDEVQNLDQKLDSPLGKFLTEGRKFGLCLIAATQTLSNLKDDEKARLFQAAHKLFFKPADSELKRYSELVRTAAQTGTADEWKARLSSLVKGQCISIGPAAENDSFKVRVNTIDVTSLEARGF
ncbi:MAG: DUF87 domain-containing protein [Kiritimatiellae bacterium]|nr:DUF87 domain-containing protein [Kiritimatiellia bacterium]